MGFKDLTSCIYGCILAGVIVGLPRVSAQTQTWVTEGFASFREGTFDASGENLYVSRKGVVQTVHRFDVNQDGFYDLIFNNTHDRIHRVPAYQYRFHPKTRAAPELMLFPGVGAVGVGVVDLNGDGFDELILGRGDDNTTPAHTSWIYWGSESGWTPRFTTQLPTSNLAGFCIGDVNNDSRPDLVFVSGHDRDSRIYYGRRDGFAYKDRIEFATPGATACLVDDFDADGFADLAVAAEDPSSGVFWGSPGGLDIGSATAIPVEGAVGVSRLEERIVFATSNGPRIVLPQGRSFVLDEGIDFPGAGRLAVGDVNRDGAADLVVTRRLDGANHETASRVYWGRRRGSPRSPQPAQAASFSSQEFLELPTNGAIDTAIADVDGDSYEDIIFANSGNNESTNTSSYVYWGGEKGYAAARRSELPTIGATAVAVRGSSVFFANAVDARPRGDIDSYIYLGSADGDYSPDRRIGLPTVGAYESCIADFDDDGFADVLITNSYEDAPEFPAGSFLYWGSEAGLTSGRRSEVASRSAMGCVVADLDADGHLDLVVSNYREGKVTLFFGAETEFGSESQSLRAPAPRFPAVADLNQDGFLDLLIPSVTDGLYLFWGSAQGYRDERNALLPGIGSVSQRVADLNGDGYLDIVVCNLLDEEHRRFQGIHAYVYWGSAKGYSVTRRMDLPTVGTTDAAIADLNNDGFLDVFLSAYQSEFHRDLDSHIYWGSARADYPAAERTALRVGSASGATAADLNGDGWIDLAVANHFQSGSHRTDSAVFWNSPAGFSNDRQLRLPTLGAHLMNGVDQGHVYTRELRQAYTSRVQDLGERKAAARLSWLGSTPFESRLRFEIRGADNAPEIGRALWTPLGEPGVSGSAVDIPGATAHRYWQYRVLFYDGRASSPTLRRVEILFAAASQPIRIRAARIGKRWRRVTQSPTNGGFEPTIAQPRTD